MNKRYFSKSAFGFFSDDTAVQIPEDAVEITEQEWNQLLQDNSAGKTIVFSDELNKPISVEVPQTMANIRAKRNSLLSSSDWTQMSDASLSEEEKIAWSTYRQALRDLPEIYPDPTNVVWPTKPE